jgi:hypothetical protein
LEYTYDARTHKRYTFPITPKYLPQYRILKISQPIFVP